MKYYCNWEIRVKEKLACGAGVKGEGKGKNLEHPPPLLPILPPSF